MKKVFMALLVSVLVLAGAVWAEDVEVKLGSGADSFVVKDSTPTVVASIGASGKTYLMGNVGIGTPEPMSKLHIRQAGSGWDDGINITNFLGSNTFRILSDASGTIFSITANKDYTKSIVLDGTSGKVGIGTLYPGVSLEVNGDLKLAAMSAPTPAAGKIYFDSSTNRLNYHDGSMWIEVDPAVTTKEVKMAINTTTTGSVSTAATTFTFPTILSVPANTSIIITSFNVVVSGGYEIPLQYELLVDGATRATFFKEFEQMDYGGNTVFRNYGKDYPIPLKVSGGGSGVNVTIKVSRVSGTRQANVRLPNIEYIDFPF